MYIHKRVRVRTRKSKAYVNNKDLYKAILEHQKSVREYQRRQARGENPGELSPQIPRYIGECIMLICTNLANKPNFYGYTYKEELIGDAIEKVCMALKNFNPKKSQNPFAYFTQVAYNAFIYRLNKEKEQSITKAKNFEKLYLMNEIYAEEFGLQLPSNEYTDDLLRNHEVRESQRKKKVKVKKVKKKVKKNARSKY